MKLTLLGHFSVDVNVVGGVARTEVGGGVFYGGIAAARLGIETRVVTKCAPEDRGRFDEAAAAGVSVVALPSPTSTSIRNDYPTDNPDDRITRMISRAAPFTAEDLAGIEADFLHVNPLWYGEFPPDLLRVARTRCRRLGADAQGFLRHVGPDGLTGYQPWEGAEALLPLLDVLKVDVKEGRYLTGLDGIPAARALRAAGVGTVLLTHRDGFVVAHGDEVFEAPFTGWTLAGRTGRGDTCTAAFLSALDWMGPRGATCFAAEVTSAKMAAPGPYRGPAAPPST